MANYYPIQPMYFHTPPRHSMSVVEGFTQGLVAAGCVSAFQDAAATGSKANGKRVLRYSLQGGTALAAETYAAEAVRCGDYARAVLAAAVGAAGVMALEKLLGEQPGQKQTLECQQENQHE